MSLATATALQLSPLAPVKQDQDTARLLKSKYTQVRVILLLLLTKIKSRHQSVVATGSLEQEGSSRDSERTPPQAYQKSDNFGR